MARGAVELNSVGYALRTRDDGNVVGRENLPPFVPVISNQGNPTFKSLANVDSRFWGPFTGGFGRDYTPAANVDDPLEFRRFYDATAETRFEGGVWLGLLNQTNTNPTNGQLPRASTVFNNVLYSLWDGDDTAGGNPAIISASLSGTTWTGSTVYSAAANSVGFSMLTFEGTMIALFGTTDDHKTRYSTNGTTWSVPTTDVTAAAMVDNLSANENFQGGLLVSVNNKAVACIWNEDASRLHFYESTGATIGDVWTDRSGRIPTGRGPLGVAAYPGLDGNEKLYVLTEDGVWEVDASGTTYTAEHVVKMRIDITNGPRIGNQMAVFSGGLWFSGGSNANTACPINRLTIQNNGRLVETGLGLDVGDGVPAARLGACHHMVATHDALYMSVGGDAANRHTSIFAWNGQGWHSVFRNGTADQGIDWFDIKDNRLQFGLKERSDQPDSATSSYLDGIATNPATGIALPRQTSGYVQVPYYDAGLPTTNGVWIQARMAADSLSANTSGEFVRIEYGVNGASRTTVDLGDIISGTLKLGAPPGTPGIGVSGVDIGFEITLNRDAGTNTDTPRVRSLEVRYLKLEPTLERFTFMVDLEGTAAMEDSSVETVIASLEAARDLVTLATFTYANITQTFVKVRELKFMETLEGADGIDPQSVGDAQARRYGFAEVVCDQVAV